MVGILLPDELLLVPLAKSKELKGQDLHETQSPIEKGQQHPFERLYLVDRGRTLTNEHFSAIEQSR
jgi:hypothetical protein